jgi:hypothetical protein
LLSGAREEQVLMDRFYDVGAIPGCIEIPQMLDSRLRQKFAHPTQTAVSCALTIQNTITKRYPILNFSHKSE